MKLRFLGTGPSQGLPVILGNSAASLSTDPKDKRWRTAAKFSVNGEEIIIDCGPDFRMQMLESKTQKISAICITHEHNDHINGLDDIRPYYFAQGPISIYCTAQVAAALKKKYHYFFEEQLYPGVPEIHFHIIDETPFFVGGVQLQPIPLTHGKIRVTGFRIGNWVYITDCNGIPESSLPYLQNIDVLVINALRFEAHHSHYSLQESLQVIQMLKPKRAYLTALGPKLPPHEILQGMLPQGVYVAYDGLEI